MLKIWGHGILGPIYLRLCLRSALEYNVWVDSSFFTKMGKIYARYTSRRARSKFLARFPSDTPLIMRHWIKKALFVYKLTAFVNKMIGDFVEIPLTRVSRQSLWFNSNHSVKTWLSSHHESFLNVTRVTQTMAPGKIYCLQTTCRSHVKVEKFRLAL